MKDYLIIADGDFLTAEQIKNHMRDKIIIALDGATNQLHKLAIIPDIILGDLDSIHADVLNQLKSKCQIIHTPDQNHTDLIKAIRHCDENQAASIEIICALGGKQDLHEANLRALYSEHSASRRIRIHTAIQTIQLIKDESISFSGEPGSQCGILAYPQGIANSEGLQYELCDYPLEFAVSESISNYMLNDKATVSVEGSALVVMPLQGK